jgi:hypothetical protein
MPSTYKKDKPWDTDDINKWEVEKFTVRLLPLVFKRSLLTFTSRRTTKVVHSSKNPVLRRCSPNTARNTSELVGL